jgi:hypothetical protein
VQFKNNIFFYNSRLFFGENYCMRNPLIILISTLFCLMSCKEADPISPESKSAQIEHIGWIYSNAPADYNSGRLTLDISLYYSGASLQPADISSLKITISDMTWDISVGSSNFIDSLHVIRFGIFSTALSDNASVLPIGSFTFDLELSNGFTVSKTVVFPAPGSLSVDGYSFIYTEDYSAGVPNTFAKMIQRPIPNSISKNNDTIKISFTCDDKLFYNGYIWFFNSAGKYVGLSSYFRNNATKALSNTINNGSVLYSDGMTQNVLTLSQQNCSIYSPFSFNDIYSMRIVITDGIQYKDSSGHTYDCRAISTLQHL